MSRRFAEDTKVPVAQSVAEIGKTVARYGGEQFIYAVAEDRVVVGFTKDGRQVRFQVSQSADAQDNRRLCRALLLVLKAKLEAVESGVAIFDDEFLSQIVMPDGKTLGEHVRPMVAEAYVSGQVHPLLPDYSGAPR